MFNAALESVTELVNDFRSQQSYYLSPSYQEQEVRRDFIDRFFTALGWDVMHKHQRNPYKQEVKIERKPDSKTQRRADYAFYIEPDFKNPVFFVEAKKPSRNLRNADDYFQTVRYAWNAGTPIAVLTDFEEFHILDARFKPNIGTVLDRLVKQFRYEDYADESKFGEIFYLFGREAVSNGSLQEYEQRLPIPKGKGVQQQLFKPENRAIDNAFLEDLDGMRISLASAFKKTNKDWDGELLTEAVQRTLDRLVFLRFLEDRLIEPDLSIGDLGAKGSAWDEFVRLSKRLNAKYNGVVFREHQIDRKDTAAPVEREFVRICQQLSRASSPYDFNAIPIHILGSIYERFLGKVIRTTAATAKVEEKPEVRKAGGVYYTPKYIVDYIVDRTVGVLIEGKSPVQVSKMRFADIACGSGSFLITVYESLLKHHTDWYNAHPDRAAKEGCHEVDGHWVLSLKQKQNILLNNVYGVDKDPQAIEVTQLSLYLKLLEDETTATANDMQILFHEKILPDLSGNVVAGNSLVSTDILEGQLFSLAEERELYPLDYRAAFPSAMKDGGFDAIVGNPPYVRQESLGKIQKDYFKSHFEVYHGVADLYVYFIERAIKLLRKGGRFGYIVANKWMRSNYGKALRTWLSSQGIEEITDFADLPVFQGVITYPCILVVESPSSVSDVQVATMDTLEFENLGTAIQARAALMPRVGLQSDGWSLSGSNSGSIIGRLQSVGVPLRTISGIKVYFGIKTGLNDAFVLSDEEKAQLLRADPRSAELIRPFLVGKDIKRYGTLKPHKWLVLVPKGWTRSNSGNVKNKWAWLSSEYPAIADHLSQFEDKAKKRFDQGDFWWELRSCEYYEEFEKPKIVLPDIAARGSFTLDTDGGLYSANTTYIVTSADPFLLGLLNSTLLGFYFRQRLPTYRGGYLRFMRQYLEEIPIAWPIPASATQGEFISTIRQAVSELLSCQGAFEAARTDRDRGFLRSKCESFEASIDEAVFQLYGLKSAEIEMVRSLQQR